MAIARGRLWQRAGKAVDDSFFCEGISSPLMLVVALINIKTTLQIKAIFRVLNTPPRTVLTSPKAAKSAIFVRIFPARFTTINIIKKVTPKGS